MVSPTYNNLTRTRSNGSAYNVRNPYESSEIIEGWRPSEDVNMSGEEVMDFLVMQEELATLRRMRRREMRREIRRAHMGTIRYRLPDRRY